jgi:hypothetical protein
MLQNEDTSALKCSHNVSSIQCELWFVNYIEKPKSFEQFREELVGELIAQHGAKEQARRTEEYRPKSAPIRLDDHSSVRQQPGTVSIQSDCPPNKASFMQQLSSLLRACQTTYSTPAELKQLTVKFTQRFEFTPFDPYEFEVHKYFNLVPQEPASMKRQDQYLLRGDANLHFDDPYGNSIDVALKFCPRKAASDAMTVELMIAINDCFQLSSLEDLTESDVVRAFDVIDELTVELTTPTLHQLLNWI